MFNWEDWCSDVETGVQLGRLVFRRGVHATSGEWGDSPVGILERARCPFFQYSGFCKRFDNQ